MTIRPGKPMQDIYMREVENIVTTDFPVPFTCWHSKDGGPWAQVEVGARSVVGWNLGQLGGTDIYDDGYGNRYSMNPQEGERR